LRGGAHCRHGGQGGTDKLATIHNAYESITVLCSRVTSQQSSVRRWRYAACLLLFSAFTVYVSLYPWTRGRLQSPDPWSILTSTAWLRSDLRLSADIVLNVLFYLPFGVFGIWSLPASWGIKRIVPVVLAGAGLSLAIEVAQFDYQRVTSPVDLATNTIGVIAGAVFACLLQRTTSWAVRVVPALLVACWLVHVLLEQRVKAEPLGFPVLILWGVFAWLFLAFIDSRALSRFAGATVFVILAGLLFWEDLQPFSIVRKAAPFEWRPFIPSIQSSSIGAGAIISRKLFHYGAALFALICARVSLMRGAAVLCVSLFILEQLQRFLPGRTPELTDPVVVLLWALIFRLVLPVLPP